MFVQQQNSHVSLFSPLGLVMGIERYQCQAIDAYRRNAKQWQYNESHGLFVVYCRGCALSERYDLMQDAT